MEKLQKKIGLIGAGAVGTSFLYAAINQGIATNYVIIDAFENAALGNAYDLSDTQTLLPTSFASVKAGSYADLKDADLIVISAGKPRKAEQTRLDIVQENAWLMHEIGVKVQTSGFQGVTLIASNPVDVLTLIYQEASKFSPNLVLGASTNLDSARLRRLIGEKLSLNPSSVAAFVLGEHGDSAVVAWSQTTISNQPLSEYLASQNLTFDCKSLRDETMNRGGEIIGLKGATFYGIGASLTQIVKAVLNDEKRVFVIGAKPDGEYKIHGVYLGLPTIVGKNGCEKILEWKLTAQEKELLTQSGEVLLKTVKVAQAMIEPSLQKA